MNKQQIILLSVAAISAALAGFLIHSVLTASASASGNKPRATETADASKSSAGTLASRLQPNMRAVSIAFKDEGGVESLLSVNDRVDVIVTRERAAKKMESVTILRDARVLIGTPGANAGNGGRNARGHLVTLELTSADAEAIATARNTGKLSLVLAGAQTDGAGRLRPADLRSEPAARIKVIKYGVSSLITH